MAWVVLEKAKVVKDDETGVVGILTDCGCGEVVVIGSGVDPSVIKTLVDQEVTAQMQSTAVQESIGDSVTDTIDSSLATDADIDALW